MNFHSLETHLSKPRLHRYFLTCHNQRLAAELYKMNLEVAQAFHPLLGTFEVALRNHLSNAVGQYFNDPDWSSINNRALWQIRDWQEETSPFSER